MGLNLKTKNTRRLALLAGLLLVLALGISQHEQISDWIRVQGYTPTSQVTGLVTADSFTDTSKHLFLINRPAVVAKATFSSKCKSQSEQTIVLGCYHSTQNGIYVLQIAGDSRLDGVMQVTAAHEMLHAAYDRLSDTERREVDGWLQSYYKTGLRDERIKQTIDAYRKSEPDALTNEMHSIFATEVPSLPPNLEQYYSRYFTDRQKVVGYASTYQAEFVKREQQLTAYDSQLRSLKQKIESEENLMNVQTSRLRTAKADMDNLKGSGEIDSYNARVAGYNRMVELYNQYVTQTKSYIRTYNEIVAKRNAIATEQQQLVKELSGDNLSTIQ